jgi:hypothetical protein
MAFRPTAGARGRRSHYWLAGVPDFAYFGLALLLFIIEKLVAQQLDRYCIVIGNNIGLPAARYH